MRRRRIVLASVSLVALIVIAWSLRPPKIHKVPINSGGSDVAQLCQDLKRNPDLWNIIEPQSRWQELQIWCKRYDYDTEHPCEKLAELRNMTCPSGARECTIFYPASYYTESQLAERCLSKKSAAL